MTDQPASKADWRFLCVLVTAGAFFFTLGVLPATAAANEMNFGVDEVQEEDEEDEEDATDDDVMDFGAEEVEEDGSDVGGDSYSVAVVAVPTPAIDDGERAELEEAMLDAVGLDPDYEAEDGDAALAELEAAGLNSCVTESLCLANVGRDVGVDRILLGTVDEENGMLSLNIDLFDVEDKLFAKYATADSLASFNGVMRAVEPTMRDIFDMRVARDGPNYGSEADSAAVQRILAYGSAAVAAGALGTGIYFGLDASSKEDDLRSSIENDETFTQRDAESLQNEANRSAVTANILYGSAVALGVVSGILFYVEGGSDVGSSGRAGSGGIDFRPSVGLGEVGFDASIRF